MPLVSMREMLIKAKAERYAVGQYNINGLSFAQSFLQAANEEQAPIILAAS
ncbi:class II fructose-bisphosphate aldolase, partial [Bacillus sp. SIMBA_069]